MRWFSDYHNRGYPCRVRKFYHKWVISKNNNKHFLFFEYYSLDYSNMSDHYGTDKEKDPEDPVILPEQVADHTDKVEVQTDEIAPPTQEEPLSLELLEILGKRLEEETPYAPAICGDIAIRWKEIIQRACQKKGLTL